MMVVASSRWWRSVRGYVLLYTLVFFHGMFTRPTIATPDGWRAGMMIAALLALAGTLGSWRIVAGISRGHVTSIMEVAGMWGIVVFALFHATMAAFTMVAGADVGLSWGRAAAHAALAVAVYLAARRRPVIRKAGQA